MVVSQFKEPEETWQACSYPSQPPRAALSSADQVIAHSHDQLLQKSPGNQRSIVKLLFQPRARPTQYHLLTIPGAPNFWKIWQNPAFHKCHSPEPHQNKDCFTSTGHSQAAKFQAEEENGSMAVMKLPRQTRTGENHKIS